MVISFMAGSGGGGSAPTQTTISVSGETAFDLWANAFYLASGSTQNVQVQWSLDSGATWVNIGEVITAGNDALVSGIVKGSKVKLKNNDANVTVKY